MQATFVLLIMCTHGARSLCGPVMSAVKQIHPYVRWDIIQPQTHICYEHVTVITPMGLLPLVWKFDPFHSKVTSYRTPVLTLRPAQSKPTVLQASLAFNSTNLPTVIHSFSSLSYDRSKTSSKASFPHSAIQSFLLQMSVPSPFLKLVFLVFLSLLSPLVSFLQ